MFKPAGYNSLSPYLIVNDAEAAMNFVKAVFDAPPLFVHRTDAGVVNHAEVRIDDTVLMLGQSTGGSPAHLHVYVPDIDAMMAKAVAAGGTIVQQAMEKGDGDRRGGVADPTGTVWWLSTQMQPRG